MAIQKWDPFMGMDRFFDEDFWSIRMPKMGWDLAVDVSENADGVMVEMNVPGIDPNKVDVTVEDSTLVVSGSRDEEKETKKKNYYSKQIQRGSFQRTVKLPASVDGGKADAEYTNGVLKITIPKRNGSKGNRVKVRSGNK